MKRQINIRYSVQLIKLCGIWPFWRVTMPTPIIIKVLLCTLIKDYINMKSHTEYL